MSDLPQEPTKRFTPWDVRERLRESLLANIKEMLPELKQTLEECCDKWTYEDSVYRFYHQSFKVFRLQPVTEAIVKKLGDLLPGRPLDDWFMTIVREGTGKVFEMSDNDAWLPKTRPILEAFFHARFFLEMAVRYGEILEAPPSSPLPFGWAALLYLYDIR